MSLLSVESYSALASMPLICIDCVVGAFQRKTDFTKPATPVHVELGGDTMTNVQYVLSPQTIASQALRATGPFFDFAKPQGSFPSAIETLALALCCPKSFANAVDPMPSTMHWPVFGIHTSSPL